ncbi:ferritin-like domain-containing protein [Rubrivirga sp.]|uniref:YciE/YciF ferroxidase family protein n=1 Tax=Rubrivirga sp. TaxID=1885344 RepID=UPI003B5267D7
MPTITDLHGLFLHTLKDIYYAEQQVQKLMPMLAEKATSDALTALLQDHADQSEEHVDRLERVFEMIGEAAAGVTCEAMDGIVKEAKHLLGDIEDAATRDAAIVASAQAIDHYEITRYGSLTTWAEELGHPDAANLLGESLADEEESDDALTALAEDRLNQKAA